MSEREDNVYKAKLAEQAERYDGKRVFLRGRLSARRTAASTVAPPLPRTRQPLSSLCSGVAKRTTLLDLSTAHSALRAIILRRNCTHRSAGSSIIERFSPICHTYVILRLSRTRGPLSPSLSTTKCVCKKLKGQEKRPPMQTTVCSSSFFISSPAIDGAVFFFCSLSFFDIVTGTETRQRPAESRSPRWTVKG